MSNKKPYPLANYQNYRPSRNPYASLVEQFEALPDSPKTLLSGTAAEEKKGQWRRHFSVPESTPINLELGTYHGETSLHLAGTNPNWVHLGVEWKFKVCFKAGKKARDAKLKNLTFLRANSARLPWLFEKGEVSRVWVLFPDPWSRSSQHKWRLLQPEFLHVLGSILQKGSELMIKTDHADYFQYILTALEEVKLFDVLPSEEALKLWQLIPHTPFERIFVRQGLPIYSLALTRNSAVAQPPQWRQNEGHEKV